MSQIEQRIGAAIRAARKSRGMTQPQLARAAGVSASTIGNYERGTYANPHAGDLERVFAVLGIDPEDPTGESDPIRKRMPSEVRTILDVLGGWLSALPPEQRDAEISHLTDRIFPR